MRDVVTYLLPIRASQATGPELTDYLRELAGACEVIVVDGSPADVFAAHAAAWSALVHHVAPAPEHACANGKVHGVRTGLDLVRTPLVVIADDDVRYTAGSLAACIAAMQHPMPDGSSGPVDVVRPQNHFSPCPWHATWDTGRVLVNRAFAADFPGTLVVRTEALRAVGGYDGDVLFENLELLRTVSRAGGRVVSRPDLLVRRLPPTTRHFLGQRVRQAYDELARPAVLGAELAVLPCLVAAVVTHRTRTACAGALAVAGVAAVGRARHGGREVFPRLAALAAPLWVLERTVCAWLALGARARGGVRYGDGRIRLAASPRRR